MPVFLSQQNEQTDHGQGEAAGQMHGEINAGQPIYVVRNLNDVTQDLGDTPIVFQQVKKTTEKCDENNENSIQKNISSNQRICSRFRLRLQQLRQRMRTQQYKGWSKGWKDKPRKKEHHHRYRRQGKESVR